MHFSSSSPAVVLAVYHAIELQMYVCVCVGMSVCVLVMTVISAKMAESIEMLFADGLDLCGP